MSGEDTEQSRGEERGREGKRKEPEQFVEFARELWVVLVL